MHKGQGQGQDKGKVKVKVKVKVKTRSRLGSQLRLLMRRVPESGRKMVKT